MPADLILRALQFMLECAVLLAMIRYGRLSLFPLFGLYLLGASFASALWIPDALWRWGPPWNEFSRAHLWVQIGLTPLKVMAAVEALALRHVYIQEASGNGRPSLGWTLGLGGLFLAGVFVVLVSSAQMQANAPAVLAAVQRDTQIGLAAVLSVAAMFWWVRADKSPPKSQAHLSLLALWFLVFAVAHSVPMDVRPADGSKAEMRALAVSQALLRQGVQIGTAERWGAAEWARYDARLEPARVLRQLRNLRGRWNAVNYGSALAACGVLVGWWMLWGKKAIVSTIG